MLDHFETAPRRLPSGIYEFQHGLAGVTRQFLEDAAIYDASYSNITHWRGLLEIALRSIPPLPAEPEIFDAGCGSGNMSLSLLDLFPDARILAADISVNLLEILYDKLEVLGKLHRCTLVSMDLAADNPLCSRSFDLVVGGSILRHLLDPGSLLRKVCRWLRPGRCAVFFEPFAPGNAIMATLYQRLVAERDMLGLSGEVVQALERIVLDTYTRLKADPSVMPHLDDKWLFTVGSLDRALHGHGTVRLIPLDSPHQFEDRTRRLVRLLTGSAALPEPAWEIVRDYDRLFGHIAGEVCSAACVIVTPGLSDDVVQSQP